MKFIEKYWVFILIIFAGIYIVWDRKKKADKSIDTTIIDDTTDDNGETLTDVHEDIIPDLSLQFSKRSIL